MYGIIIIRDKSKFPVTIILREYCTEDYFIAWHTILFIRGAK